LRTQVNLMITMLLGGLWHGAAWNYILWGGYQGGLLVVHSFFKRTGLRGRRAMALRILSTVVFIQFICYGWLLFRARSLAQIADYSKTLIAGHYDWSISLARPPLATLLGVAALLMHDLSAYRSGRATFYRAWDAPVRASLYAVLAFLTLMGLANARSAFIYFQF
jgi:alginate O-acetyltransferase complex protein AlgI